MHKDECICSSWNSQRYLCQEYGLFRCMVLILFVKVIAFELLISWTFICVSTVSPEGIAHYLMSIICHDQIHQMASSAFWPLVPPLLRFDTNLIYLF